MEKNVSPSPYLLGTDQAKKWEEKYFYPPRGYTFVEPGIEPTDCAAMSAYNIAKSSYQTRPDVFNMDYLTKTLHLPKEEIMKRMKRMYHDHLIMYVANFGLCVEGFGLYYWIVKLNKGTDDGDRRKLIDWYQGNDEICTGYATHGDFDFFNGNHMRVLDNLLTGVIDPWKSNPQVKSVELCPIRRDMRESGVNMIDAVGDDYRQCIYGDAQLKAMANFQNKMDLTDLRLLAALNAKRPMSEVYDYKVLAEVSGLDPKRMEEDISRIVDTKRLLTPLFHLDFAKVGLTNHMFVIRTFQTTPSYRKAEMVDELMKEKEFNTVFEFTDSYYDISCWAYNEISDIDALRKRIYSYSEVESVMEADGDRQFRRWTCRLDADTGNWEECVFTDDFLENRTEARDPAACRFTIRRDEK